MPNFRVTGLTAKKGRPTTKTIGAETPNDARRTAEKLGLQVETVERLASEPASQAQLSYARSLGIEIPPAPTLEQMTSLISRAVDPPASPWLVARAVAIGAEIDAGRYASQGYISGRLIFAIGRDTPAYLKELATWFLFSVLRHRRRVSWESPDESGIPFEAVNALAGSFIQDTAALKSLKREYRNGPIFAFLAVSNGSGGALSDKTIAFARAVELLTGAGF